MTFDTVGVFRDEFNNLKKFQKLLLETKMIHR